MKDNRGEIIIYQSEDGSIQTEVRLEAETLWLNQYQLVEIFETDRTSIVKHIQNILETGELEKSATCAKFAQVRQEGKRRVKREILHYNLDMIISVGYRVNSRRGTQFRIWANRVLKEYLLQGYSLNRKRLQGKDSQLQQLRQSIQILERSLIAQMETMSEARNAVSILSQFAGGLEMLDDYDHEQLEQTGGAQRSSETIEPGEFFILVEAMRPGVDSNIFGVPKDDSFESSVRQIYQSFDGKDLYPSIEHKAAMLLYLVVKNHSFVDGNKRIAAAVFLYFLDKNGLLFNPNGRACISNEALAALTLLIAISKTEEKETMVNIVITILNRSRL